MVSGVRCSSVLKLLEDGASAIISSLLVEVAGVSADFSVGCSKWIINALGSRYSGESLTLDILVFNPVTPEFLVEIRGSAFWHFLLGSGILIVAKI